MPAKLYLIPVPLGPSDYLPVPQQVIQVVHSLDHFIVERGKTARRFLKDWKTPIPFQEMTFFELNKRTDLAELPSFLEPALKMGKSIGLMSEAGCPGVADPGAAVIEMAHAKGIEVVPLVGPSSILLALMASGFNGQCFGFEGYLPIKKGERQKKIKHLYAQSKKEGRSQIFIETPYRNMAMLEDLLAQLPNHCRLCVAADISLPSQYIKSQTVAEWKKGSLPDLHKRPTVFLFLA
ncbi:SAM-dependent methyltransferase [Saprospira sp. CCB-QB6]|uniref:SAM-dependent methyltransferase n=1 Tax=Saprospira sp. CCB-QB6 TaxID=3023936 RepID=UPI00234A7139|nr:SAM-dependent methyltransferase [Saprospira sp. CCB-QB6]WCL80523.1 SAM-dependent methyltransferase [Saprospira sp. CCB-QB6]